METKVIGNDVVGLYALSLGFVGRKRGSVMAGDRGREFTGTSWSCRTGQGADALRIFNLRYLLSLEISSV